jgi:import inner membrane translocase subunit TIM44
MKILDPSFSMEAFERELREYIVPEVVDAYLSADNDALKLWCSEAVRLVIFLLHYLQKSNARMLNHPP